ncbi:MAG: hypothetical protein NVS4B8_23890 [Herpetosiphon sp.]
MRRRPNRSEDDTIILKRLIALKRYIGQTNRSILVIDAATRIATIALHCDVGEHYGAGNIFDAPTATNYRIALDRHVSERYGARFVIKATTVLSCLIALQGDVG